nr:MAG TPA_asm: hypothetical protein [Caudoviricetes sp.]
MFGRLIAKISLKQELYLFIFSLLAIILTPY